MEIDLTKIENKMNVIIGLLVKNQLDNDTPEVETIYMLNRLGLDNESIAKILNKTTTQISKQLYKAKKRKK